MDKLKRIFALALVLILCVSYVPAQVFATEEEPVAVTEPVIEEVTEPETEPATEPETEAATEAETEPVTEPATEPETEPVTEPATEPETEPATEPETEPVTEPITEPATEPETEPVPEVIDPSVYSVHNGGEVEPQLIAGEGIEVQINPLLDNAGEYLTVTNGVYALRDAMEKRQTTAYISVYFSNSTGADTHQEYCDAINAIGNQMYERAIRHTGNPTEGDYLLKHFNGMTWNYYYYSGSTIKVDFTFTIRYLSSSSMENTLDYYVDDLLDQLNVYNANDYVKIKTVYDWLTRNVNYDYAGLNNDNDLTKYTAYGAIVDRSCVCQGFANAFYRLMLELNVDARYVGGTGYTGSGGGPHGWNIVELGGIYYDLDSTWDEDCYPNYSYFLLSEDIFSRDHERREMYTTSDFLSTYTMSPINFPGVVASGTCNSKIAWVLDATGALTVSGTGAIPDYDTNSGNYAPWYNYRGQITKVAISKGVTAIGEDAFASCTKLSSIDFGSTVTKIGAGAFLWCDSLTKVSIPAAITSIGNQAFAYCAATTKFSVSSSNKNYSSDSQGALYNKDKTILYQVPAAKTSFKIPTTVTRIHVSAFSECNKLTSVTVPKSVNMVDTYAFGWCEKLTKVIFEGKAPTFGAGVFYGNTLTAYYPAGDTTWTSSVRQQYDGTVTWAARLASGKTGLIQVNGVWGYYKSGIFQSGYTGLVKNTNGIWYYVQKGKWNSKYNGLVKHTNGIWYCVQKGRWDTEYNGLVKHTNGIWYYVEDGRWDDSYNGLVKHTNGIWYCVQKGRWDTKYNGLIKHTNGIWYYVEDGRWDTQYNGFVKHTNGIWYYVQKGRINWDYTGVAKHTNGTWYYAKEGRLDWNYTGLAKNASGAWYYVENGRLNWNFTGTVNHAGKKYKVVNGRLQ